MELIFKTFSKESATVYDTFISNWMPGYKLYMELLPGVIKSQSETIENILSVGCGTGNELLPICKAFPNSKIIGIDPSEEMLKIAKNKTRNFTNIDIIETTIDTFKSDIKFDVVTLTLVLHFMPDDGTKLGFLKEISKKMKSGGCLVLSDIFGSSPEINQQLNILKSIVAPIATEEELYQRLEHIRKNFDYIDQKRLNELLTEAGFNLPNKFFQSTIYSAWVITKK